MAKQHGILRIPVLGILFLATTCSISAAGESKKADKAGVEFFEKKIRPVLVQNCYECHSAESKSVKGGLLLDSREGLLNGGESGAAVVPGHSSDSLLIEALKHEGLEMPPNGKLTEATIADFARWIDIGLPDPRRGKLAAAVKKVDPRAFWAYQQPRAIEPPKVRNTTWPRSNIDGFILAALEAAGLEPVGDADRVTLLRRVTFDLIGLPPTPDEIRDFQRDKSPDAFERVVDRLLASPHFGERWGRHWLDVARYGESTGKERNIPYSFAWRYRDWVIDAVNADMPYDQFIREQVAGDLLPSDDDEQHNARLVATGFLALGPKSVNEKNSDLYLMDVVDEQIDVTCRAVLATTAACARCHDHKFDPIPTSDYYALAGIFRSTKVFAGVKRGSKDNDRVDSYMSLTGLERVLTEQEATLARENPELLEIKNELTDARKKYESMREKAKKNSRLKDKAKELAKHINELEKQLPKDLRKKDTHNDADAHSLAMGVADSDELSNCHVCIRGDVEDERT